MNANICAKCNVCQGVVPVQRKERILFLEPEPTRFLVLDDPETQEDYELALRAACRLLGTIGFTYSATVRCDHNPKELIEAVISRCAVWTNLVSEGRSLIVSTRRGLSQLKVGDEWKEGDVFRAGKLGVVLCIPPLLSLSSVEFSAYREKAKRVLREAGEPV